MRQLDDKGWATRQQVIQLLAKLSENCLFYLNSSQLMNLIILTFLRSCIPGNYED